MLYVDLDQNGKVTCFYARQQYEGQQTIPENDPLILEFYATRLAAEEAQQARDTEIANAMPTWTQVDSAITNIGSLADAKVFLRKLSRVIYLHIKNSAT
jgi:hypothetical protein